MVMPCTTIENIQYWDSNKCVHRSYLDHTKSKQCTDKWREVALYIFSLKSTENKIYMAPSTARCCQIEAFPVQCVDVLFVNDEDLLTVVLKHRLSLLLICITSLRSSDTVQYPTWSNERYVSQFCLAKKLYVYLHVFICSIFICYLCL